MFFVRVLMVLSVFSCSPLLAEASSSTDSPIQTLKGGWYAWEPYQYLEYTSGQPQLEGLDIDLQRGIAALAGVNIEFEEVSWDKHTEEIKSGVRQIAAGATLTPEREVFAYFTIPYRRETNGLYTFKGREKIIPRLPLSLFFTDLREKRARLGVIRGFRYVSAELNDFIDDPANKDLIVPFKTVFDMLNALSTGQIDVAASDRLTAVTLAWRMGNRDRLFEVVIGSVPVHIMLSKKSTTPEMLEKMNAAIEKFRASGDYGHIVRTYAFPILMMQTIDRPWFLAIDILGTIAFAISGLFIAWRERATLFTTFVYASLPAIGGGVIRDLVVNRVPLGAIRSPIYMFCILATVLIGALVFKWLQRYPAAQKRQRQRQVLERWVQFFDALGLGAFSVIGVNVAVSAKLNPLWLWAPIMAVLTGTGGGIIRDLMTKDRHISAFSGELYAEIAIAWGAFLGIFLMFQQDRLNPDEILVAVILTMAGVVLTRLASLSFHLKSFSFAQQNKATKD
ncbi:MAG: TRIC cation channel family protein [Holosporales bacterium]